MTVKQFCAVVMAVLLVAASGTVVALPAADAGSNAIERTVQQQGNETGNQTDNVTVGNETDNVTANASLTFRNQTANGTFVVVQRVFLSAGGFVEITNARGFSIGNSTYLQPGVHTDVRVRLDNPLADSQTLTAFALRDVNDNRRFDGRATGNASERPYRLPNGSAVTATAFIEVRGERVVIENETNVTAGNATNVTAGNATAGNVTAGNVTNASAVNVTFLNQTTNGTTVTVQRVRLPAGGFVAIHQTVEGEAGIVVGTSQYLEPGNHTNVTVRVYGNVTGSNFTQSQLEQNATLIAMPHRDTNDNRTFDFVVNASFDGPYLVGGEPVTDSAFVALAEGAGVNVTENVTGNDTANVTAGNASNATVGNQSVAADLSGDENETGGGNATANETMTATGPSVTLVVENQTGNGTTLNVTRAVAGVDFFLEARANGTLYNTTTRFNASEAFTGALTLRPELVNVSTVEFNVTLRQAGNGTILAQENVTYTLVNETANATTGNATAGNATNVTAGNVTDGNVTAGNATNETEDIQTVAEPNVTFENQTSNGTVVVVERVALPTGGFVAIHDASLYEGMPLESVVGVSEYLDSGVHHNVTVELYANASFEDEELLVAMPHRDTNGNMTFEFVTSNGTEDTPYTRNGTAIVDNATVTFTLANETMEGAANETTGNATAGNATDD